MKQLLTMRRQLLELRKALVYIGDGPIYVDARHLPLSRKHSSKKLMRRRRWIEAFFAWHGIYVLPVFGFDDQNEPVAAMDGVMYPLRAPDFPFSVYETAVVLIRDGMDHRSAFDAAWMLEAR
jgi:hypothetical protein